jgi:hypothetical protein
MSQSRRVVLAVVVALLAGAYPFFSSAIFPGYTTDFDQLWWAANALRAGADPYAAVAARHAAIPGVAWGLVYPLPAVVLALPLSFLPLDWARATLDALGAAFLTYFVLRRGLYLFPILLSGCFRNALSLVQPAPLIACAAMSPWFGWATAYKPNAGIAVLASSPNRRWAIVSVSLAGVISVGCLLIDPSWPLRWFEAVRAHPAMHVIITRPGGFLVLLAALRWRRPEARWLIATALIPATASVNAALPLLVLAPATLRQALCLAILSHAAEFWGLLRPSGGYDSMQAASAIGLIWLLYLPAVVLILRRPNSASDGPSVATVADVG